MYELKVLTDFSAAHQLRMVSEKCENLHGHNWKIEVRVEGEKLNDAGIVMDFGVLKKHVAEIMSTLDHKFLNELDFFPDDKPSSENIAKYVATSLQSRMTDPSVRVASVSAWESDNACATFKCA